MLTVRAIAVNVSTAASHPAFFPAALSVDSGWQAERTTSHSLSGEFVTQADGEPRHQVQSAGAALHVSQRVYEEQSRLGQVELTTAGTPPTPPLSMKLQ